ncbi:MAG: peptidoglycan DD-metalloendopeptidase family protein [Acidimicrobiales bacterium]
MAVLCILLGVPLFALTASSAAKPTGPVAGIPERVLRAYQAVDGWCTGLRWQILAGIGSIESGHGTSGGATVDRDTGYVAPHIFGPPLDGSPGIEALPIGKWIGWFGLTGPWQQAVGPMQFLPGTFVGSAVDQDGDGVANPHDIDDAVATAANYLCGGTGGTITDEHAAVLRYNHDEGYAAQVLAYADQIGSGAAVSIVCPVAGRTTFTNTWLAPRSGGRQHKGVDIFADEGTPVVAPVDGDVELAEDPLGGLAFHLWGDDRNYFYGAHLSAYTSATGRVIAGTVLGYVGHTGNADETAPHLHFESHPGRSRGQPANPVDPTPATTEACRSGAG